MRSFPYESELNGLLRIKLLRIKLVATDFDGVHTDGSVYVAQDGCESVRCSRIDGLAYDMLRRNGYRACIISKETNTVVTARAKKLKVPCIQSVATGEGKLEVLDQNVRELSLVVSEVLYMGDDINDLRVLEWAGVPAAPANAHPHVIELVRSRNGIVTRADGGNGAIREVVEILFVATGQALTF